MYRSGSATYVFNIKRKIKDIHYKHTYLQPNDYIQLFGTHWYGVQNNRPDMNDGDRISTNTYVISREPSLDSLKTLVPTAVTNCSSKNDSISLNSQVSLSVTLTSQHSLSSQKSTTTCEFKNIKQIKADAPPKKVKPKQQEEADFRINYKNKRFQNLCRNSAATNKPRSTSTTSADPKTRIKATDSGQSISRRNFPICNCENGQPHKLDVKNFSRSASECLPFSRKLPLKFHIPVIRDTPRTFLKSVKTVSHNILPKVESNTTKISQPITTNIRNSGSRENKLKCDRSRSCSSSHTYETQNTVRLMKGSVMRDQLIKFIKDATAIPPSTTSTQPHDLSSPETSKSDAGERLSN